MEAEAEKVLSPSAAKAKLISFKEEELKEAVQEEAQTFDM